MSVIAPTTHKHMMLPEAIQLEERIHADLGDLDGDESPLAANNRYFLQTLLTEVQDRIAHFTSLLTF